MNQSSEAHFAQRLASNQPHIRERALKKLGLWFKKISDSVDNMEEEMMLRLWKGIFYYFWHCDKMLVQENRADVISKFIHVFKTPECAFMYVDTFFQTMSIEWNGIDRYRLEKFMMLVRKFLHETYQLLKNLKFEENWMNYFFEVLGKNVLNASANSAPFGLKSHVSDIYMEELARVASDKITPELLEKFLVPYCTVLCKSDDPAFISSVKKEIFMYLLNQDEENEDKETDDDEEDEYGKFPVLKFDASSVQKLLLQYAKDSSVKRKHLKVIHSIVKEFEDFRNGLSLEDKLFPKLGPVKGLEEEDIEKATLALFEEDKAYSEKVKAMKRKRKAEEPLDEIESESDDTD